MTAVATIAGAMPIALGLGTGSASRQPLGYAVVGGLLFSTFLTLFLVPIVWVSFETGLERLRERRAVRAGPTEGTLLPGTGQARPRTAAEAS